ncbi:MAG: GNAT family N-acetyltransferase [Methylotenera sp.]|nr:GNAT family N-acetyltransferase [Methylotenera sp.]
MKLSIETLFAKNSDGFDDFYNIYSVSFPLSEQKLKEELFEMLCSPSYTFFISKTDDKTAGFCIIFHSTQTSFYLLEYMAVDASLRNLAIGSKLFSYAIEQVTNKYGIKPLLVEIDSPQQESQETEIRKRRERFYKKLGCRKIDSFDYILAIKSEETAPPMKLLVYHNSIRNVSKPQLMEWLEDIYMLVYGCSKDDERIAKMLHHLPQTLNLEVY